MPKMASTDITCYFDADHASDLVTRRSVTGILLFLGSTPVRWYSKRQNTVESSTYGSEFVAARISKDMVMEFRYKLRMLGVPVDKPSLLLGDNLSVITSCTLPSSSLKKKHNAIAYHGVREAVAAGVILLAHVKSKDNLADILTKSVNGTSHRLLVGPLLFQRPVSS